MKSNNKKSTYTVISGETGISITTISRILHGSPYVREATRKKVLEALNRHGYNTAELEIKKLPHNSGLLILNISSMENSFYSQVAQGAKAAARRHGYQLLINEEHINDNTMPILMELIQRVNPAGIITTNQIASHLLKKLNDTLPLVQCCEFDSELNISHVSIDDIAASKNIMEYLLSLGKRQIAFINGPIRYKYARHRLQGYLESLKDAGIPLDQNLIIQLPDVNYNMAISAVAQMMHTNNRPDAFFCVSDIYAAAVIKSCAKLGVNVPRDVMVAGFDNVDISSMVNPAITTINQPKFQLGFSSCELLADVIHHPGTGIQSIVLETELIIRESTSPGKTAFPAQGNGIPSRGMQV